MQPGLGCGGGPRPAARRRPGADPRLLALLALVAVRGDVVEHLPRQRAGLVQAPGQVLDREVRRGEGAHLRWRGVLDADGHRPRKRRGIVVISMTTTTTTAQEENQQQQPQQQQRQRQ